jgi:hypothetical protein
MPPHGPPDVKVECHTHALPVARVGIREILPADVGGGKGSWLNKHTEQVRGAALHQTPRCRYLTEPASKDSNEECWAVGVAQSRVVI